MRHIVILLFILLLLLQYKLWLGEGSIPGVWELKQALEIQRDENERLRERNLALEADVKDLRDGLEAVEERARMELGMVKEGETFFQIVDAMPVDDEPAQ